MSASKEKGGGRAAVAEEKYRPLKKAMKKSFAVLNESVEQERLPPAAAVEQFLAEAKMMIAYPGFGDEHYPEFAQGCEALAAAHGEQDLPRFRELFAGLRARKKECHGRYK